MAERLDSRERYGPAMERYLSLYGFHINKPLFEFAVSKMKDRSGNRVQAMDKEKVDEALKANGVTLKNDVMHDAAYVYHMGKADYLGSSVPDEAHLAKFVKDYVDDVDGSSTRAFDEFIMRCNALGIPIDWWEVL